MAKRLALVVDDEADIRNLLEITLARMGIDVECARNVTEAQRLLGERQFDLCLTDMRMPDGTGIDLIRHISEHQSRLPVAVITAHGNVEAAVEALKAGAFDFVSKPVQLEVLRNIVHSALKIEPRRPPDVTGEANTRMLGSSRAIMDVRRMIGKLARSQAPVHISGESGVGKELAARMVHELGPRGEGPFVPVNCGAIPTELMESEFFGHRKGSFTGAVADKQGLFQTANGGTLFLDEVAELPLHMQVKLLRVIQEKSVRPVGATAEQTIDVRVLSATHKNLLQLVEKGEFRQDLYYRINVIELRMPSLRERPSDIEELATHFVHKIARSWEVEEPKLDPAALEALQAYPFPGNVRELENILERAMTLCEGDRIREPDLSLSDIPIAVETADVDRGNMPLEDFITGIERDAIMKALEETRYNKTAAARRLGITFRALRYRLKKLDLE